ncbi:MAG: PAS domain S-box protein [Acidobacteriota bacterium]
MKNLETHASMALGHLMHNGPVVVYTVDPATMRTTTISSNVERELGYTVQEYLAPPGLWRSLLHPEDAPGVFGSFPTLFKTGEISLEYRMRRKDGQWRWMRDDVVLRSDPEGKPLEIVGCAYDIDDRKLRERVRDQEATLFEAMFREHRAVMLLLDPDSLDLLDANHAALQFYGWTLAELRAMNFRQVCQDGPACHNAMIQDCREKGGREAVCRHLVADGSERKVDIRTTRIQVAERTVLFCVISDITARVQAEQALRESESRLRSISENSIEGIFQSTPGGRFLWVNPACARIFGYTTPAEMVASIRDIGNQFYADSGARWTVLAALRKDGILDRREVRLRRRDGHAIWVSLSMWTVMGDGGDVERIEGVMEDITARKMAESERMLLATAVEQAGEGMAIVTGGTWRVEYANPAFGRILGLERPELLGRDFFELFGSRRTSLPARDIKQAMRNGQEWAGLIRDIRTDLRPMTVEAAFSPIRDESGRVGNTVVLLRDVSHQDRLERRLRRAHKLEAVGTLAGGIAHDFNNILTPILLNAEVGMQLLEPGDILRRPLEEIIQAGGRARQLIKQILAFSRRGDLRAARMELAPIVQEALRLLRSSLPPDVEVRFDPGTQPLEVMADSSLVHQVVTNLADNALHAMRVRGGRLEIRLEKRVAAKGEADGCAPPGPGEYALLAVSDTGHGMDKALLDRIFTPFFTTKKPGEGTGMGLSTVYGIARSQGGAVRVESTLGEGSLFEVYLPLAGAEMDLGRGGALRRALVVDTQAFSRRALGMTLAELGYKSAMMRDAGKALKAFAQAPDRFDLVLAGEDLHGMSGRGFLKSCRELRRDAVLVLLTDRDESGAVLLGVADAVLQKPVGTAALVEVLQSVP